MGQLSFFDIDKRLTALSAKGDPLEAIDRLVPWESFRADIEMAALTPDEARKSNAGRKPIDAILMLRMLMLQSLYNLSDEQVEYQVRDRLSFTRFLTLRSRIAFPTARRCGCSARSSRRLASSKSCSIASTIISTRMAISLAAVRSSMLPSWRCPDNATRARK